MDDKAKIKLDGVEYELISPDEMKMGEQREFEKIAGESITAMAQGYKASVIVAWLAVSIKRTSTFSLEQIVARLDDMTFDELNEIWEQVGPSPPDGQPPSEDETSDGPTSSTESSSAHTEPYLEHETQSGIGVRSSDTGSASDPQTLVT